LHVATFKAEQLDKVISDINGSGYGLTFGLHTRIDDRVEEITTKLKVGNMYINRNQIGAVVGSQPFGGEGLSGTGPKAGGPRYVPRFMQAETGHVATASAGAPTLSLDAIQASLNTLPSPSDRSLEVLDLPGPTGESNRLSSFARGTVLCLGPTAEAAMEQATQAASVGCAVLAIAPNITDSDTPAIATLDGKMDLNDLRLLDGIDVVVSWAGTDDLHVARQALASRKGALIPLVTEASLAERCVLERHICIDTTAAGGNASLLAATQA
jgi:RHH-type proline utilization regulon transcriptional repressor/proline dehydrogenase/delta 1-pyrroline-5-carboxylate dehydrogenase